MPDRTRRTAFILYRLHKKTDPAAEFEAQRADPEPGWLSADGDFTVERVDGIGDAATQWASADGHGVELRVRDGGAEFLLVMSPTTTQRGISETDPRYRPPLDSTAAPAWMKADMLDLMAALKH